MACAYLHTLGVLVTSATVRAEFVFLGCAFLITLLMAGERLSSSHQASTRGVIEMGSLELGSSGFAKSASLLDRYRISVFYLDMKKQNFIYMT